MATKNGKQVSRRDLQNAAAYLSEAASNMRTAADLSGITRLIETADMVDAMANEMRAESYQCCG